MPPKSVLHKLPRFQLLGASDCENPSAIARAQILEWQKQGIIEYLGETKDVRPFLESSSCVVLPSFYKEGVPRVLLEAMSMGKPIITTNIAGCRECVAPPFTPYENLLIGQNGILIPPKDINALALAISLLTSNTFSPLSPATLTQMGAKARAFVKGRFDIARIMECYKRAVRENSASGEQCGSVARYGKGTNAKLANLYHNAQSSHSPTAKPAIAVQGEAAAGFFRNLRILEEKKQTELESIAQVDCHADKSARNDKKNAASKKVDSRSEAQSAANSAQDSRICENTQNVFCNQATRRQDFGAKNGALQGESKARTWACVTADSPQQNKGYRSALADVSLESPFLAQKPTPRLAFVSNTCFGMYNFRLQVLKSLQQSGFAIHIIAPFDESTRSLEQEGFSTHNLYLDSRSLNPLKDFRTTYALYKLLKHIRPALVFNYTIKPAIYSSSVCNFLKIPNIAVITGLGFVFINDKGKNCSIKKRVLRSIVCLMYRFALKKTQEVWFLNNDDKQEFLSYKLIKQNQAFLLDSEGVDTEYFSPKSDVKAQEQGEIVFLLVARMLWDKGVGEFVEAAKMVQESMKEANKVESNGGGGHNKTFAQNPLPTFGCKQL
ncbi:glycosyltransferase [Helicobacter canis]|uniref:glycosyltransferase n=1 Tax=Helicobacter canis TaxID=29419 RepID=UPI0029424D8A|nr:glycosyltransferase [Helicobacter canis]